MAEGNYGLICRFHAVCVMTQKLFTEAAVRMQLETGYECMVAPGFAYRIQRSLKLRGRVGKIPEFDHTRMFEDLFEPARRACKACDGPVADLFAYAQFHTHGNSCLHIQQVVAVEYRHGNR